MSTTTLNINFYFCHLFSLWYNVNNIETGNCQPEAGPPWAEKLECRMWNLKIKTLKIIYKIKN